LYSCSAPLTIKTYLLSASGSSHQQIKKWLFYPLLLVLSSQPTSNPTQTQNQKRLFLQIVIEDEVVGLASLLLKIKNKNLNQILSTAI
jgi:hypothetical protein